MRFGPTRLAIRASFLCWMIASPFAADAQSRQADRRPDGKLHVAIVTSYFGKDPVRQAMAGTVAQQLASTLAPEGPVEVVPFEMQAGTSIPTDSKAIAAALPSVHSKNSKGGHDNEAASHWLAERSNRWLVITNSPSTSRNAPLRGGRHPEGSWTKRLGPINNGPSLMIIGSESIPPTVTEGLEAELAKAHQSAQGHATTPEPSMQAKVASTSPAFSNLLLVLIVVPLVVLVLMVLQIRNWVQKSASRQPSAEPPAPTHAPAPEPEPEIIPTPTSIPPLDTSEFKHLIGNLDSAVKQITDERSDGTAKLRQNLAEMRADIARFDETVLTYASLLLRMQRDSLNDLSVRENCEYLLGRLKRYFERSGLDIILPSEGDEFQEDLHAIAGTVPAGQPHAHMQIASVEELGIRRGHEVRQQAKVIVAVEDAS